MWQVLYGSMTRHVGDAAFVYIFIHIAWGRAYVMFGQNMWQMLKHFFCQGTGNFAILPCDQIQYSFYYIKNSEHNQ